MRPIPNPAASSVPGRGRRVRRELARAAACVLAAGLLGLPLAVSWAITHTVVQETVGTSPTTFTLSTRGASELRLGIAGTVYLPASRGPIGVVATVDGPGDPGAGDGDLAAYVRPEMLTLYAGLFHDPETAVREYVALVEAELERQLARSVLVVAFVGGLASYGVLRLLPLRRSRGGRRDAVRVALAGGLVLVLTTALAWVQLAGAQGQRGPAQGSYALGRFEGTLAAGASTDSPVIRALLGGAIERATRLVERQEEQEAAYRAEASAELAEHAALMTGAREGERAVMMQSDMHCNTTMIALQGRVFAMLGERYGAAAPHVLAIAGDLTTNGTAAEGGCIRDEAAIASRVDDPEPADGPSPASTDAPADGPTDAATDPAPDEAEELPDTEVVAITGNHETELSEQQMSEAGMRVLDGSVEEVDGLRVLGDGDPERTELFGGSRLRGEETLEDVGVRLRESADEAAEDPDERPDLVMVHEIYTAQAFLGVESASALIAEVQDATEPDGPEGVPLGGRAQPAVPEDDGVADVPASVVLYGHWHRSVAPRVLWNDDGTWTLLMELDTSGGAIDTPTIDNFSTPWSQPRQQASFPVLFLDEESGLVTGYQRYVFEPDGDVIVEPRVEVGPDPEIGPEGAPAAAPAG